MVDDRSRSSFENEFHYSGGLQRFNDLMLHRVEEILIISSPYDYYMLSEDGGIYESIYEEYASIGLTRMPGITRASGCAEALQCLARKPDRFNLIIVSVPLTGRYAIELAEQLRRAGVKIPLVLLATEKRLPDDRIYRECCQSYDMVFMWQGDYHLFIAIIKQFEDRLNIEHDTRLVGTQSIILIEDDPRFYSSLLPLLYSEVFHHTARLVSRSVNRAHKQLRMKARTKIVLCRSYEEAWHYFEAYHENVMGVVSDLEFPRAGRVDPLAGFSFIENARAINPDISVLFQSLDVEKKEQAEAMGACFVRKTSDTLLHELRSFMIDSLGFGDFVFRLPDGTAVGSASDLRGLEEQIRKVPIESILYHAGHNHFSRWLKSRTEHLFARKIRAHNSAALKTEDEVRNYLTGSFREYRQEEERSGIVDFNAATFDPDYTFARIGGGSLGGKARGLGFSLSLLRRYSLERRIAGVRIMIPPGVVLATDVFDRFIESNKLADYALQNREDQDILWHFERGELDNQIVFALKSFLEKANYPLAVRSSSLLEDSHEMPFAGIYETLIIPNNEASIEERLARLLSAVKKVYASTFFRRARLYVKSTPYRLEEEKMAVIIQKLAGTRRADRYYPDFSGVLRSYNYYPVAPMKAEDGIASVAVGLGKIVVEGGNTTRFCPLYPCNLIQFSSPKEILKYSQRSFYALQFKAEQTAAAALELGEYDIEVARHDGVLRHLGSTYSPENDTIYDSIGRPGVPLVTFAPVLKRDDYPLCEVLRMLLRFGDHGFNAPIELEFAVNLNDSSDASAEFYFLQIRPIVTARGVDSPGLEEARYGRKICQSRSVLGNGVIRGVRDLVLVDPEAFERSDSRIVAREIGLLNAELLRENRPYVLIGAGRWGSADPWLGIPVHWEEICGARVIVEAELRDIRVDPSQGSHFFHNITSSGVGYFTVNHQNSDTFLDWKWLASVQSHRETRYVRHLRLEREVIIMMDGQKGHGIIALVEPPEPSGLE